MVIATGLGSPAVAQSEPVSSPAALNQAAATITAADLAHHVGVLADDSMRGRATPSRELDQAAQYVAAQFRQWGLKPLGRDTTLIVRYPVPGQLGVNYELARVDIRAVLSVGGRSIADERGRSVAKSAHLKFAATMYYVRGVGTPTVVQGIRNFVGERAGSGSAVILAGHCTAASVPLAIVQDKVVLYIPSPATDSVTRQQVINLLYEHSAGVMVVSDLDSSRFAAALANDRHLPVRVVDRFMRDATGRRWPWAVAVRPEALEDLFAAMDVDVVELRSAVTPVVQALPLTAIRFEPGAEAASSFQTAPNVVGVLEGSDPALRQSYLLVSAHVDAAGARASRADRVDDGANDDASGVAGLLALVKAFSRPDVRPRRSLIFLVTSGGAAGKRAWGSNAYVKLWMDLDPVAVVNLDVIGRLAGDSLFVDGLQDTELAQRPEWVAAEHPELKLIVQNGGTVAAPSAEYFPFVRYGLPTLSFRTGRHGAVLPGDTAETVDAEETARVVRFVLHVSDMIANADSPPRWTAEGRQRLAAAQGP